MKYTLMIFLLGVVVFTVALFAGGYAVSDYRSAQTFEEYRQQQTIEAEMQKDFAAYRRASAAHMEAERAKDALSGEHSRIAAAQKKEFVELWEAELESEKMEALQDVREYMEVSK